MANMLTDRITRMIAGIRSFENGELTRRLDATSKDEMGELAQSFNMMADSVTESFKRLEDAKEKAEEASRMKSEFLASMSHELRTPLNGILGFSELLQTELTDPAQIEYTRVINDSGQHLLKLVNEILDLSKVESGKMEYSWAPVAPGALSEELATLHRSTALGKGLELNLELAEDLPGNMTTDATRLRQILNNLLSNAVKFTDTGRITLAVKPIGKDIAFAVTDTGPGIPPEAQAMVFEKFKQLESFLTRQHQGTGLGLALVKQLVEHMGGRVTLDSVVGEGSTFTVYLPQERSDV
jgi:signal transduction histidine kinase